MADGFSADSFSGSGASCEVCNSHARGATNHQDVDLASADGLLSLAREFGNRVMTGSGGQTSGILGNNWRLDSLIPGLVYDNGVVHMNSTCPPLSFSIPTGSSSEHLDYAVDGDATYQLIAGQSDPDSPGIPGLSEPYGDDHTVVITQPTPEGVVYYEFYDPDTSNTNVPSGMHGKFLRKLEPDGGYIEVSYTGTKVSSIISRENSGSSAGYTLAFAYSGNLVSNIVMKRDTGTSTEYKKASYYYYGPSDSYGNDDDLRGVVITDLQAGSSGVVIGVYYYEYWKTTISGTSYQGGLKTALDFGAYDRYTKVEMENDANLDYLWVMTQEAPSANAGDYASAKYEYEDDTDRRVNKISSETGGCTSCGGGSGSSSSSITMTQSAFGSDGPNIWRNKTTITTSGNGGTHKQINYTNHVGQTMLEVTEWTPTGGSTEKWYKYNKYGESDYNNYKLIMTADSEAVNTYSDSGADLVDGGDYLESSQGLITHYDYHDGTYDGETNLSGDYISQSMLHEVYIKKGRLGSHITQQILRYEKVVSVPFFL